MHLAHLKCTHVFPLPTCNAIFFFRSLSNDLDNRDSRYKVGSHDAAKEIGHLLHQYRESSHYESGDTLRDLSLPVLAGKAGEKYKSGFELGRPFFGLAHDNQGKEQGTYMPVM